MLFPPLVATKYAFGRLGGEVFGNVTSRCAGEREDHALLLSRHFLMRTPDDVDDDFSSDSDFDFYSIS